MSSTILHRSFAAVTLLACLGLPVQAQDAAPEEAPAAPQQAAKPRPRKPPAPKPAPTPAPAKTAAPTAAAAVTSAWSAGASSLSETYGSWTVSCTREDNKTECTLLQAQGTNGKRQFAVEIRSPSEGRAQGLILMPLGFSIEPGVSFKLDEAVLGKGAPFLSCTIEGCLVPVSLPTLATDTMKTAQNLTVSAMKPDAKEPATITVPLTGFAPALARAVALSS